MLSTVCFVNASAKQGVELKTKKISLLPCVFTINKGKNATRSREIPTHVPFGDCTGAKSEKEEGRKPINKVNVIPALTALPISSDAQCLLCCQHSALLSFGQILCRGNPG